MKDDYLELMPTYSECGSVMTIIISHSGRQPLRKEEIATMLEFFAYELTTREPQDPN